MDLGELVGSLRLEDSAFGKAISGALDKLGGFARSGAKIAATAGVAIATALGASIVANMSIEEGQNHLAAQLGATEEQSARYGKVAGELYAQNYGESLSEVNGAIEAVVSSIDGMRDASGAAVQEATRDALNFASAFEVDVARAAQVAGQMIKTGLAEDSSEAFDLLITSLQRVPVALREDILDAVDEYGPMFAQLGYTGEQAFAMLIDGAETGMYGIDKTGDAVKELTIRATDMSTASVEAYNTIGLGAEEMANQLLAGGDTAKAATDKIILGLLSIEDPALRANTSVALFGTPLEDLSTAGIPKFLEAMQGGSDSMAGFGDAADRLDTQLNDGASASLGRLKREVETAFYALGNWALPIVEDTATALREELGPAVEAVGDFIKDPLLPALSDVVDWLGENETAVKIVAGVITGVLVAALGVWAKRAVESAITNTIAWWSTAAASQSSATVQSRSALQVVVGWLLMGTKALAAAGRMALAWVIALGPIGWAIAAIIAVVALVILYWDEIKAATKAAWEWVVEKVKGVPGAILDFFMNWTLPGLIIQHWDSIKSTFTDGVSSVVQWMRELPGKILGALGDLGSLLWGVGEDIMNGLLDGIDRGLDWVRDKLGSLGSLIPGWLKDVLGISSPSRVMRDQVGRWIPAGVADGVEDGIPGLRSVIAGMADSVVVPIAAAASYQASVDSLTRSANRVDMGAGPTPWDGLYGGPLVEQHVHPSEGMSEETIGRSAANSLQFTLEQLGVSP